MSDYGNIYQTLCFCRSAVKSLSATSTRRPHLILKPTYPPRSSRCGGVAANDPWPPREGRPHPVLFLSSATFDVGAQNDAPPRSSCRNLCPRLQHQDVKSQFHNSVQNGKAVKRKSGSSTFRLNRCTVLKSCTILTCVPWCPHRSVPTCAATPPPAP